jgi:hypothetical protein
MLNIKPAQMQALDAGAWGLFLERLTSHFQQQLGISTPHSALRASIEVLVTRAQRYGMSQQDAIAGFVGLALTFGMFFDFEPRVREVLTDARMDPDERIDLLPDLVADEVWDAMPAFHEHLADQLARRESAV